MSMKRLLLSLALLMALVVPSWAASTKIPVIYSCETGRVRSWINFNGATETDALLSTVKVAAGECLLLIDRAQYGDLTVLQSLVTAATNKTPTNDRYAIVDDKGAVIGATIADSTDQLPDKILIPHAKASKGWTFDKDRSVLTDEKGAEEVIAIPTERLTP